MELKKVAAIIVTHNRKQLLVECLNALINQEYKNLQILVVDNCSSDGTKEFIEDFIDKNAITYVNTGENIGGAGGFNFGLKVAYKLKCDYFWLMDDDCMVHSDTLTELIKFASDKNDNFGFLSSVVLWGDGSICKMNVQKTSLFNHVENFEKEAKIEFATFVSFFVRKSVVEKIGLPIKEFFIWGDDLEYSKRISKQFDCYLVPTSKVTHKSKSNIGSNIAEDNSENLDRYRYAYRNEWYLYNKIGLFARLYYFLKIRLHYHRINKSNMPDKKKRKQIIKQSIKEAKTFNPCIEFLSPLNKE